MNLNLGEWKLIKSSQIENDFNGFDDNMIFELTDGTIWYQSRYKYHYYYAYRPKVNIYQKANICLIIVDGMDDYAEVTQTTGIKAVVVNDFNGWSGSTIFQLDNGQVWEQAEYSYMYKYEYLPEILIVEIDGINMLHIDGESIRVRRIK